MFIKYKWIINTKGSKLVLSTANRLTISNAVISPFQKGCRKPCAEFDRLSYFYAKN